jgi:Arylsulfotransferase (ASST)
MALGKRLSFRIPVRLPGFGKVLACLSILGFGSLCYLFGAAVVFLRLPSYDFLYEAFMGAKAWHDRGLVLSPFKRPYEDMPEGITVDKPTKTYDGFTLLSSTQGSQATLFDMRGKAVHQWELPFSRAWPSPPHIKSPLGDDQVHWFRCHLFPNGDLLAIYQAESDTPAGYGLIKLDKDSKVLWKYEGRVHHDLDVDEKGTIYTLTEELKTQAPAGLGYLRTPYVSDSLVVLSADGRETAKVSIEEAFRDSPYSLLLSASIAEQELLEDRSASSPPLEIVVKPGSKGDRFHANSVKVLSQARAGKFPLFQAGQVLISLRSLHTIAVLDVRQRSVTWAARGMWRLQHDAEFLDNGHLLLFDNYGSTKGCRVLEYDPVTQAIPWVYSDSDSSPFYAFFRGMKQRLPNGNTLIVDPDKGRLFEVTVGKELVWENYGPRPITGARRYAADELTFLQGVARPRP